MADAHENGPLPAALFARVDESPDALFYREPRFALHVDDATVAALTELYREEVAPGARVLDLMSSWVSHLPGERPFARVAGLGMNEAELAANPRLDEHCVRDLNADPALPWIDAGSTQFCVPSPSSTWCGRWRCSPRPRACSRRPAGS